MIATMLGAKDGREIVFLGLNSVDVAQLINGKAIGGSSGILGGRGICVLSEHDDQALRARMIEIWGQEAVDRIWPEPDQPPVGQPES